MKKLAMVVGTVLAGSAGLAVSQDRDGRRDGQRAERIERQAGQHHGGGAQNGGRHWDGQRHGGNYRHDSHRQDAHRHGYHGRHGSYVYPRHYYGVPRSYGYYSSAPVYGYYAGPPAYSYAPGYLYAQPQPPIIVERVYEQPPIQYEERSYAQAAPRESPPRPPAPTPAQPAPRLERYTLSATELFEFDKAELRQPQPRLDEIANVMRHEPRIDNVTITGHTDRLGTNSYNLQLSQRRAEAVKAYLVGKGVEAPRLRAIGKGESNPVVQCNDRDQAALIRCLEPNRRVEVEQITVTRQVRP